MKVVRSDVLSLVSSSPWNQPATVTGFAQSPPNATLIRFVKAEGRERPKLKILDIGCGAGRNAGPLADAGHDVLGMDLSTPMIQSARFRAIRGPGHLHLALAQMDAIPARDRSFDLVIAHGIWNLARSGAEFRRALREAARVSTPQAALFVFTFSRHTLPPHVLPVPDETFVFTQFSGQPQCFLTGEQLVAELGAAGFTPDPAVPLTEHNRPRPGLLNTGGPVIYEGAFRFAP